MKTFIPGWRHMTAAQRYNARMDKIFEGYREHVEKQRTENPAYHTHLTEHLMSNRYEGCEYGYCAKVTSI